MALNSTSDSGMWGCMGWLVRGFSPWPGGSGGLGVGYFGVRRTGGGLASGLLVQKYIHMPLPIRGLTVPVGKCFWTGGSWRSHPVAYRCRLLLFDQLGDEVSGYVEIIVIQGQNHPLGLVEAALLSA